MCIVYKYIYTYKYICIYILIHYYESTSCKYARQSLEPHHFIVYMCSLTAYIRVCMLRTYEYNVKKKWLYIRYVIVNRKNLEMSESKETRALKKKKQELPSAHRYFRSEPIF